MSNSELATLEHHTAATTESSGIAELLADLREGRLAERRVIGSGQLRLPTVPNGLHRAEVQKVFVGGARRGRGVGTVLMAALNDAARQHGRSLLLLNTHRGGRAEAFYKRLGYREVGAVPGYTMGPSGEQYDSTALYHQL